MWANWLPSLLTRGARPRNNSTRRSELVRRRRPRLDALEDRWVPAAVRIGSTLFDIANAVAADGSGNVLVAGQFRGTVDFDPGAGVFNLTNADSVADGFLVKYTSAGA